MDNAEVDIIIPCYNMSQYLPQAIESALAQTYRPMRILVVDDGSTEDIQSLVAQYDGRVDYLRQDNAGAATARNAGVRATHGEYLCFLDADDIILPSKIHKQLHFLREHPAVDLVHGRSMIIGGSHPFFPYAEYRPFVQWDDYLDPLSMFCPFPIHSALMRRRLFDRHGLFPAELKNKCEDWAFWLHCVLKGAVFSYSPTTTALYRQHSDSVSSSVGRVAEREAHFMRLAADNFRKAGMLDGRRGKVLSCGIRFVAVRSLLIDRQAEYRALLDLSREIDPNYETGQNDFFRAADKNLSAPLLYLLLSKELCDLAVQDLAFYSFLHAGDVRLLRREAAREGLSVTFREVIGIIEKAVREVCLGRRDSMPDLSVIGNASLPGTASFEQLERQIPDRAAYISYLIHQLGLLEQESGRSNEAATSFERAVCMNPYFWRFYEDLALAVQEDGRRVEAEKVIRQLLACNSGSSFAQCYLGKVCLRRLKITEGMRYMRSSFTSDPRTWARCMMGRKLHLLILNCLRVIK